MISITRVQMMFMSMSPALFRSQCRVPCISCSVLVPHVSEMYHLDALMSPRDTLPCTSDPSRRRPSTLVLTEPHHIAFLMCLSRLTSQSKGSPFYDIRHRPVSARIRVGIQHCPTVIYFTRDTLGVSQVRLSSTTAVLFLCTVFYAYSTVPTEYPVLR